MDGVTPIFKCGEISSCETISQPNNRLKKGITHSVENFFVKDHKDDQNFYKPSLC
jgi:hypothetical protein